MQTTSAAAINFFEWFAGRHIEWQHQSTDFLFNVLIANVQMVHSLRASFLWPKFHAVLFALD